MDRLSEGFINRMIKKAKGLYRLLRDLVSGQQTLKQVYLTLEGQIITRPKLNDDFNWERYPAYYKEELLSVAQVHTLLPNPIDFQFSLGKLTKTNLAVKDLHPNHQLLYEIILKINPNAILEVGCGGGDHLRNLLIFNSKLIAFGVDRSEGQVLTLRNRHPQLDAAISIVDVTASESVLPSVDLVYTQAVLMHISETNERLAIALNNILQAATSHVVLIENWTQHNFFLALQESIKQNPFWNDCHLYFVRSRFTPSVRALVLSKNILPFEMLYNYDELLQGAALRTH